MKEKELVSQRIWKRLTNLGISPSASNKIPLFQGQGQAAEQLRGLEIYTG